MNNMDNTKNSLQKYSIELNRTTDFTGHVAATELIKSL